MHLYTVCLGGVEINLESCVFLVFSNAETHLYDACAPVWFFGKQLPELYLRERRPMHF